MPQQTAHHNVVESKQQNFAHQSIENEAFQGISYYTPVQRPPAGTASDPQPDGSHPPKLFQPLKLRGVTLQNRLMLSPLCQYSAEDGHHTAWHFTHLGGIVQRGPGLTMVEATSVTPEGRITPEDSGLWKDSQMEPLKKIVEFAHSQGQHIGIQIAHAGRKASTVAPWLSSGDTAAEDVNGWPDNVYAPSAIPYSEKLPHPKELTKNDIENLKEAWVASVKRAIACGFDVIEIHNAHGYLLHSFLSPASNKRTDEYGGNFENRTRLTREIVQLTRETIPKNMPLFLRISATDWLENEEGMESWKVEDTVKLAGILADMGVDLLDVSSGGLHPKQKLKTGPGYQAPFAKAIKEKHGDKIAVGTVGTITSGKQANQLLEEGLDLAIIGRMFQKNPGLVWTFAEELGVQINVANQIRWGFGGRPGAPKGKIQAAKAGNSSRAKSSQQHHHSKLQQTAHPSTPPAHLQHHIPRPKHNSITHLQPIPLPPPATPPKHLFAPFTHPHTPILPPNTTPTSPAATSLTTRPNPPMDHSRDPCPWVALSDFGGAFCMGGIGGAVWHGVKGFRNSPYGERRIGAVTAIKARAPVLGGNFGVWGGLFSTFDCAVKGVRRKEDPYNAIIAGFFTGGALAVRGGMRAARNSAIGCACLLAVIEGVGIGIQRMMAENTRLDVPAPPPPPPPASEGSGTPMLA